MSYRPSVPASTDAPLIMSISTRDIRRLQQQGGLILVNTVRPLLCDHCDELASKHASSKPIDFVCADCDGLDAGCQLVITVF
jgi:hypothetical protein